MDSTKRPEKQMAILSFSIRDDGTMSAEHLHGNLMNLHTVEAKVDEHEICQARLVGSMFWMWGPTGRHSLNVTATDASRLLAHWRGFVEINRSVKVRA
jgi:hypothetical protein